MPKTTGDTLADSVLNLMKRVDTLEVQVLSFKRELSIQAEFNTVTVKFLRVLTDENERFANTISVLGGSRR